MPITASAVYSSFFKSFSSIFFLFLSFSVSSFYPFLVSTALQVRICPSVLHSIATLLRIFLTSVDHIDKWYNSFHSSISRHFCSLLIKKEISKEKIRAPQKE
jgi:hypothetical protein